MKIFAKSQSKFVRTTIVMLVAIQFVSLNIEAADTSHKKDPNINEIERCAEQVVETSLPPKFV